MTSMRAPALRYVEPAVATMVASTLSPMWSFERSSMSSTLVSRRTARTAAVGAGSINRRRSAPHDAVTQFLAIHSVFAASIIG
jgi:hypothetical protein